MGNGKAGEVRSGDAWNGATGKVWNGRPGGVRCGSEWREAAWIGRQGMTWFGLDGHEVARQARRHEAGWSVVGKVRAGEETLGAASCVAVEQGRHDKARRVVAWKGVAPQVR